MNLRRACLLAALSSFAYAFGAAIGTLPTVHFAAAAAAGLMLLAAAELS